MFIEWEREGGRERWYANITNPGAHGGARQRSHSVQTSSHNLASRRDHVQLRKCALVKHIRAEKTAVHTDCNCDATPVSMQCAVVVLWANYPPISHSVSVGVFVCL